MPTTSRGSRTGQEPGRGRGRLHRRQRRARIARVPGRHGPADPGGDGQAALDRHAGSGHGRGRPEGLRPAARGGKKPILNSISPLRTEMFDSEQDQPFRPILLVSERMEDGKAAAQPHGRRSAMTLRSCWSPRRRRRGIAVSDCIIDPAIARSAATPKASKRLIGTMQMIHADPMFTGVHMSVGL